MGTVTGVGTEPRAVANTQQLRAQDRRLPDDVVLRREQVTRDEREKKRGRGRGRVGGRVRGGARVD